MTVRRDSVSPPASGDQQDRTYLIADVAGLTGVPPPQLRSWENAGLLHPRRTPNGMRLYSIDDVAWVRLFTRTVVNPGRRGSLRRLKAQVARGALAPGPEDYAALTPVTDGPPPLTEPEYLLAVLNSMGEFVVVCDTAGRVTSMNESLQLALPRSDREVARSGMLAGNDQDQETTPINEVLPAALEALPLRWAAHTGTQHRDVALVLRGYDDVERRVVWTVTPLRDADGSLRGAVGVGRVEPVGLAMREDWLAIAAHDLRGPVTNILGRLQLSSRALSRLRADLLIEDQKALDQLVQHLTLAEVSTVDLISTMNTLLDASAAAAGALIQHLEPGGVDIALLAQQAVDHAREHTSRHTIDLEAPGTPLQIAGDRQRLLQVLDNLLANAIKYAPDGGPIAVRLESVARPPIFLPESASANRQDPAASPNWVVVRIVDSGLGIPPDAIPYIFDRYWRAPGPAHGIPGTGLGLYTSRAIVLAHGGHIWVEDSVEAGDGIAKTAGRHGTVMALVLPLAEARGPAVADAGSVTANADVSAG